MSDKLDSSPNEVTRRWSWSVFTILMVAAVIQNMSFGTFEQLEEVLWVPDDERGETNETEFGCPFPFLTTEAYSFTPIYEYSLPWMFARICADLVITTLVVIAGTKYLSSIIHKCRWRPSILSGIVLIAVFAGQLSWGVHYFSFRIGSPGAITYAVFNITSPVLFLCSVFAWHWRLTVFGRMFSRRIKTRAS